MPQCNSCRSSKKNKLFVTNDWKPLCCTTQTLWVNKTYTNKCLHSTIWSLSFFPPFYLLNFKKPLFLKPYNFCATYECSLSQHAANSFLSWSGKALIGAFVWACFNWQGFVLLESCFFNQKFKRVCFSIDSQELHCGIFDVPKAYLLTMGL